MVLSLASRSLAHQWCPSRVWNLRSSVSSSFVAFRCPHSLSLLTPAGAGRLLDAPPPGSMWEETDFGLIWLNLTKSNFGQSNLGQSNFGQSNFGIWCVCVMVGPKARKSRSIRVGSPKFRVFFPPPLHFRSYCLSLGVFSWNFGGVFESRDPQMCTFGICRVNPRRPPKRRIAGEGPNNTTQQTQKHAPTPTTTQHN